MRVSLTCFFLSFLIVFQTLTGCTGEKVTVTLSTLVRTLNYLTNSTFELNDVSRLFIGIASGQVEVMLWRLKNATANIMTNAQKVLMTDVEIALWNLDHNANIGYQKAKGTRRWVIDYPLTMTKSSSVYKVSGPRNLKSNVFDNCFDQMIGQNKYKRSCSISIPCWKVMTEPSQELPYLTKQLQYLIFGENLNCVWKMSELSPTVPNRGSYVDIVNAVCSTILSKIGNINKWESMLYENVIFCGIYGFKDFFASGFKTVDYLHSLLNTDGCVSSAVQKTTGTKAIMEMLGAVAGDCYIDRTAIVVAYLIQFLKFLVEDPTYVGATQI